MSELFHLQNQLQQFILTGNPDIMQSVQQTGNVCVETRLAIYRDAYRFRLIECLSTSFPALYLYLGHEQFLQIITHYINLHPSSFRSVRWYGHELALFLHEYYAESYPYLVELAQLEWNLTQAFDSADTPYLKINDIATIPTAAWPDMTFTSHSSLIGAEHFWNVVPVWQALLNGEQLPTWQHSVEAVSWVIWRTEDYFIKYYSLTNEEHWALDALIQGLSFGELCEGLCQWTALDDVAMRAASYLKTWVQNGMLSSCIVD